MVLSDVLGFDLPPTGFVAAALAGILLVKRMSQATANIPPCPITPFPGLGHLPYLKKDARGTMMNWSKQSGEIFSLYFGSHLVIVLGSYDLMKEALVKRADIFTDKPLSGFVPAVKHRGGIIDASGGLWKENRSTVLTILREFGMGKNIMAERIRLEIIYYLEEIGKTEGKAVDARDLTARSVSNVVCSFLLGKRFEYDDKYYTALLKSFKETSERLSMDSLGQWFPWLRHVPGDPFRVQQIVDLVRKNSMFGRDFMDLVENDKTKGFNKENVITCYQKEMKRKQDAKQDTYLSDYSLSRVVSQMLIAGMETTTSTLLWFNLYMVRRPDIQNKIYKEIETHVGTSRPPRISDKQNLVYLSAAIMETQRIASIVPFGLFHRNSEETTLKGFTIPKDSYIMPYLDGTLLSEKVWGDPHNFRPERFIDENGKLLNPEQFVPFSLGRRLCVGEALARAELFLFAASVLQRYRLVPEDPDNLPNLDRVVAAVHCPVNSTYKYVKRDSQD